jgi:hypothetical protein
VAGEAILAHENRVWQDGRRIAMKAASPAQVLPQAGKRIVPKHLLRLPEDVALPAAADGAHPLRRRVGHGRRKTDVRHVDTLFVVAFGARHAEEFVGDDRRRAVERTPVGTREGGCLERALPSGHRDLFVLSAAGGDRQGENERGFPAHTFTLSIRTAHFL